MLNGGKLLCEPGTTQIWSGSPYYQLASLAPVCAGLMHACSVTGAFLSPTMFMAAAAQEPAFAGLPISGVTLTSGSGVVGLGSPMSYLGNTNTYPTSMRQPYL